MTQNTRACRLILITLAIFGSVFYSSAQTPLLEWDPSWDPTVVGYKVYCGEGSRDYDRAVDVGPSTSFPLTKLEPGLTYYFAITAYTVESVESGYSDEIYYTSPIDGINAIGTPLRLTTDAGVTTISFYGNTGDNYWVQASEDLHTWERVQSGQIETDGMFEVTDGPVSNHSMRFYRVITSLH